MDPIMETIVVPVTRTVSYTVTEFHSEDKEDVKTTEVAEVAEVAEDPKITTDRYAVQAKFRATRKHAQCKHVIIEQFPNHPCPNEFPCCMNTISAVKSDHYECFMYWSMYRAKGVQPGTISQLMYQLTESRMTIETVLQYLSFIDNNNTGYQFVSEKYTINHDNILQQQNHHTVIINVLQKQSSDILMSLHYIMKKISHQSLMSLLMFIQTSQKFHLWLDDKDEQFTSAIVDLCVKYDWVELLEYFINIDHIVLNEKIMARLIMSKSVNCINYISSTNELPTMLYYPSGDDGLIKLYINEIGVNENFNDFLNFISSSVMSNYTKFKSDVSTLASIWFYMNTSIRMDVMGILDINESDIQLHLIAYIHKLIYALHGHYNEDMTDTANARTDTANARTDAKSSNQNNQNNQNNQYFITKNMMDSIVEKMRTTPIYDARGNLYTLSDKDLDNSVLTYLIEYLFSLDILYDHSKNNHGGYSMLHLNKDKKMPSVGVILLKSLMEPKLQYMIPSINPYHISFKDISDDTHHIIIRFTRYLYEQKYHDLMIEFLLSYYYNRRYVGVLDNRKITHFNKICGVLSRAIFPHFSKKPVNSIEEQQMFVKLLHRIIGHTRTVPVEMKFRDPPLQRIKCVDILNYIPSSMGAINLFNFLCNDKYPIICEAFLDLICEESVRFKSHLYVELCVHENNQVCLELALNRGLMMRRPRDQTIYTMEDFHEINSPTILRQLQEYSEDFSPIQQAILSDAYEEDLCSIAHTNKFLYNLLSVKDLRHEIIQHITGERVVNSCQVAELPEEPEEIPVLLADIEPTMESFVEAPVEVIPAPVEVIPISVEALPVVKAVSRKRKAKKSGKNKNKKNTAKPPTKSQDISQDELDAILAEEKEKNLKLYNEQLRQKELEQLKHKKDLAKALEQIHEERLQELNKPAVDLTEEQCREKVLEESTRRKREVLIDQLQNISYAIADSKARGNLKRVAKLEKLMENGREVLRRSFQKDYENDPIFHEKLAEYNMDVLIEYSVYMSQLSERTAMFYQVLASHDGHVTKPKTPFEWRWFQQLIHAYSLKVIGQTEISLQLQKIDATKNMPHEQVKHELSPTCTYNNDGVTIEDVTEERRIEPVELSALMELGCIENIDDETTIKELEDWKSVTTDITNRHLAKKAETKSDDQSKEQSVRIASRVSVRQTGKNSVVCSATADELVPPGAVESAKQKLATERLKKKLQRSRK